MALNTGNRRSEEELQLLKVKENKEKFVLVDQTDFKGTEQQLELMQNFERAYISGSPVISDEEWDLLKNKYNYKESVTAGSPSGRTWLKLLAPLPSLDKAASFEDFKNYMERFPKGKKRFSLKLDGLTANVRYKLTENGYEFDCISSRGNGYFGLILNEYALSGVELNVPKLIDKKEVENMLTFAQDAGQLTFDQIPNVLELRGEAVIRKTKENIEKYGEFAVLRNIAAGMFNRKVPNNTKGLFEYFSNKAKENKNIELLENELIISGSDRHTVTGSYADEDGVLPFEKLARNDKVKILKNQDSYEVKIIRVDGSELQLEEKKENLDIVFFSLGFNGDNIDTCYLNEISNIKTLKQVKFSEEGIEKYNLSPNAHGVFDFTSDEYKDIKEIWSLIEEFYGMKNGKRYQQLPRYRNLMEYACDGIVIKPEISNTQTQGLGIRNNKNNPNRIMMSKYPDDQIAIKLLSEVVRVKLEKILYKETTLNNKTCSGVLDKPYRTESGAYVSTINLHNIDWLKENNWIQEGKEYDMVMAMDIIPQLVNPNL